MTREEAIAFFKDMNECTYDSTEAIKMAIKALEEQTSGDCISRQFMHDMGATCIATRNENEEFDRATPSNTEHIIKSTIKEYIGKEYDDVTELLLALNKDLCERIRKGE